MINPFFATFGLAGGELLILIGAALLGIGAVCVGAVVLVLLLRRKKLASPPSGKTPPPPVIPATVALAKCPQCQQPLPKSAPEGLCPPCLAKVALGSEPAQQEPTLKVNPQAEVARPTRVAPAPSELAAQFPQLEIIELL